MLFYKKIDKKLVILFFTAVIAGFFLISEEWKTEKEIKKISEIPQLNKNYIVLTAVGDIMLDRGVEYIVERQGDGDWRFPFLKIADLIKKSDIAFGNLEGPISDKGVKVGSIYSFRHSPEVINGLTFAGFDILSVANNHIFDYGREAMEDSFKR